MLKLSINVSHSATISFLVLAIHCCYSMKLPDICYIFALSKLSTTSAVLLCGTQRTNLDSRMGYMILSELVDMRFFYSFYF